MKEEELTRKELNDRLLRAIVASGKEGKLTRTACRLLVIEAKMCVKKYKFSPEDEVDAIARALVECDRHFGKFDAEKSSVCLMYFRTLILSSMVGTLYAIRNGQI